MMDSSKGVNVSEETAIHRRGGLRAEVGENDLPLSFLHLLQSNIHHH